MTSKRSTRSGWPGGVRWSANRDEVNSVSGIGHSQCSIPNVQFETVAARKRPYMTIILWTLAILLIVIGFVGIVLPALPGHVLIFAGLLLAAWADGFDRVGPIMLTVIGVIGAASYGVDFVARSEERR